MKKVFCIGICGLLSVTSLQAQIRYNQVGCYPDQEKVIVVEGVNPEGKVRVTTPKGKLLTPKVMREAVSPWSGKTRYLVDLGDLKAQGKYHVEMDGQTCDEFFWAASALYRLTRKPEYLADARQYQPQRFSTPSWGNVSALGTFEWLTEKNM